MMEPNMQTTSDIDVLNCRQQAMRCILPETLDGRSVMMQLPQESNPDSGTVSPRHLGDSLRRSGIDVDDAAIEHCLRVLRDPAAQWDAATIALAISLMAASSEQEQVLRNAASIARGVSLPYAAAEHQADLNSFDA